MAILHKNISAEGDIHNPKWFSGANNGDVAWRNELGVLESTDELVLPAALDFVDGSAAPPTSNSGDIYVLSSGASVNAGWGTVSLGDWVRYDGTTWNDITPQKSNICYNETLDKLFSYDGSLWTGLGGDSVYTASATAFTNVEVTIDNTFSFLGGGLKAYGLGTAGTSVYSIWNGDTTPVKLWDFLDNGDLNKNDTILNIGNSNSITGASTSYAIGWNNNISGGVFGKLAIGDSNVLNGSNSYTVGRYNNIQSNNTFQFGNFLSSTAQGSFIIGHGVYADGTQKLVNNIQSSLALGWNTTTPQHLFKTDEVILCSDSKIGLESITLSKPTAIKGVGVGIGSIVGFYNGSSVKQWDFLDNGSLEKSDNIIKIGKTNTITTGSGGLTVGVGNDITGGAFGRVALGDFNDITNSNALTIGRYNKNTATHTVGIGYWTENTASGAFSIGVGVKTDSNQKMVNNTADSLALGWDSTTPQHLFKTDGVNLTLPTSSTGLGSGDLWNDGGTVKIA